VVEENEGNEGKTKKKEENFDTDQQFFVNE
jgi:hypothetical protein